MNCPYCTSAVAPTDIFCPACGKNLHASPLSTTPLTQTGIYLLSALLPPLNLPWTIKYLKSSDEKAKTVGMVSVIIMVVSLVVGIWLSFAVIKNVQTQINQAMQGLL